MLSDALTIALIVLSLFLLFRGCESNGTEYDAGYAIYVPDENWV